jgi:hypothetical protein
LDFEVLPVITSSQAVERITPRLPAPSPTTGQH